MGRRLLSIVVCALTCLLLAGTASATSYTINTTADSNDGSCTAQKCSLRDAITAVNANPSAGGDTITLPPGTYTLGGSQLPAITGSSVNLTITGAGARSTTISGNGESRILEIDHGTVAISGLSVTDGFFTANDGHSGGGAIENLSKLTLTDVAVTDSVATGATVGGGISSMGNLTLNRVTVAANKTSSDGGGIFIVGTASITNSTISGNVVDTTLPGTASGTTEFGAGIEDNSGKLTLAGTTITDNSANPAGRVGAGASGLYLTPGDSSTNSVVAANHPVDCFNGKLVSTGPNLDDDATCFTGTSDMHGDALLQPLASSGGQTDTMALESDSPALGRGSNCPVTDQRGVARPTTGCDLGAYQTTQPIAATGSPSALAPFGAALGGTVNPDDQFTAAFFQYGVSRAYGSETSAQAIGSDYGTHTLSQPVAGLLPGTTYHFRIVAISALGTTYGTDQTFRTPSLPAHLTVGKVGVHGLTFSVPIRCQTGSTCNGTVALVLPERLKGNTVIVAASTGRRTVVAKQVSFTLAGGAQKTIKLTLGPSAKALLTRLGHLAVTVKVTLTAGGRTIQTAAKQVTIGARRR